MFKKKSVLFTWCMSYLLMIILLLGTVFILEQRAKAKLLEEYKGVTQTLHNRTSSEIIDYFTELERSAYEISRNYLVESFVYTKDPDGAKYYDLTPIQDLLSVHKVQTLGNTAQYLYMSNINKALSDETIYRIEELYTELDYNNVNIGELTNLLSQQHYNDIVVHESELGDYKILMLTSIPLLQRIPGGMMIQVLDNNMLKEIIRSNVALENSTSVLLDQDGLVVCGEGNEEDLQLMKSLDLESEDDDEISLDGLPYWIQRETLGETGWTLVTVIPMTTIEAKTQWVFTSFLPVLLIALLLSMISGIYFIYINYQPLKRLHRVVVGNKSQLLQNEYEQLGLAFDTMQSSLQQMQRLQQEQVKKVNREFLISCMEHDILFDENRLIKLIHQLGIETVGDWFGVMVVETNEISVLLDERSHGIALVECIRSTDAVFQAEWIPMGSHWALLLNAASAQDIQLLLNVAEQYESKQLQQDVTDLLYASSRPHIGHREIHLAYLEACELLQYRSSKNAQIEQKTSKVESPRFSIEQENLLMRYIVAGSVTEADELIELVVNNNLVHLDLRITMARCLIIDIISGIIRKIAPMEEVWQQQAELLERDLFQVRYLKEKEELAKILRTAVHRTAAACGAMSAEVNSDRGQPVERIIKCVEEHFRESDFNVAKVARYLDMNGTYLSSLFKSQTGVGLLSYINSLRINYAKECMTERGMTVNQAAKAAGFDNVNTFIRNFKRYEGMPPGAYSAENE